MRALNEIYGGRFYFSLSKEDTIPECDSHPATNVLLIPDEELNLLIQWEDK